MTWLCDCLYLSFLLIFIFIVSNANPPAWYAIKFAQLHLFGDYVLMSFLSVYVRFCVFLCCCFFIVSTRSVHFFSIHSLLYLSIYLVVISVIVFFSLLFVFVHSSLCFIHLPSSFFPRSLSVCFIHSSTCMILNLHILYQPAGNTFFCRLFQPLVSRLPEKIEIRR